MSSPHSIPVQTVSNYERGVYIALDYVDGITDYDKTVSRFNRLGSRALSVLGEVHLQESAYDPANSLTHLDKAEAVFSERVFSNELGFDPRAAIRLAQIPLYKSLLADKKMPSYNTLADSYQGVLSAAATAADHYTFSDNQSAPGSLDLLGTISEATVLLLAVRYSLHKELTEDWLPVQAFLSEDLCTEDSRGWDISILIPGQADETEIGHKVQVKSKRKDSSGYSRDITVVGINPDLEIAAQKSTSSVGILLDLQNEANPFKSSVTASRRLDLHTERLLIALDRTK